MQSKRRVLFIDDEPNVLAGFQRTLHKRSSAWRMDFLDSPEAAFAAFENEPYQVVVSDMAMPVMNGLDLAKKLKKISAMSQIIILTGTADLAIAIQAINETDIFRFYTKPCPASDLSSGIEAGFFEYDFLTSPSQTDQHGIADAGVTALNHLPIGFIVVNEDSHVKYMNPRGAEIISRRDGIMMGTNGILNAERSDDTAALRQLIQNVFELRDREERDAIALERSSMLRPLTVMAFSLSQKGTLKTDNVGIFLSDPEARPEISLDMIAKLFGLTHSESRLVASLAGGDNLQNAAEKAGITMSTARTYLKRVFSKTDTNRQAELVQLILTSAAVLGSPLRNPN